MPKHKHIRGRKSGKGKVLFGWHGHHRVPPPHNRVKLGRARQQLYGKKIELKSEVDAVLINGTTKTYGL